MPLNNVGSHRRVAPGRSCLECRRRKIGCDRSHPCSYCVKTKVQCTYPDTAFSTGNGSGASSPLQERVDVIDNRLMLLEQSVAEIKDILLRDRSHSQFSIQGGPNQGMPEVTVHSRETPAQTHNHSWTSFDESMRGPALGLSPVLMVTLWQLYLERVDPFIKLFHTPTTQKIFMGALANTESSTLNELCLVYAISYAAVMSMSPAECDSEFRDTKDVMLARCRNSMDKSLSDIGILNTRDMMVLQALTLYLMCGRLDPNGPNVHREIGMTIGIAIKMNLNRDGSTLGLNPFEIEVRRRLWWCILTIDALTAQDHKTDPCALGKSFNTRVPLNVNDSDLDPNMTSPPVSRQHNSEMIFTLARIELAFYSRQFVFSEQFCRENSYPVLSTAEKRDTLEMIEKRIETDYLQFYNNTVPLHNIASSVIRLTILKLKLNICETDDGSLGSDIRNRFREDWQSYSAQVDALRIYNKGQRFLWLLTDLLEFSPGNDSRNHQMSVF